MDSRVTTMYSQPSRQFLDGIQHNALGIIPSPPQALIPALSWNPVYWICGIWSVGGRPSESWSFETAYWLFDLPPTL